MSLSACLSPHFVVEDVVVEDAVVEDVVVDDVGGAVVLLLTLTSSPPPQIRLVRSLHGDVGDTPGDKFGRKSRPATFNSSLGDVRLFARTVLGSFGDGNFGEVGFTGDRMGEVSVCLGWSAVGDVGVMCPILGKV